MSADLTWAQRKRLEFIEQRLIHDGWFQRAHLVQEFGISQPQASSDIARYTELAPNNLKYDASLKKFLRGDSFAATVTVKPDAESKLLADQAAKILAQKAAEEIAFHRALAIAHATTAIQRLATSVEWMSLGNFQYVGEKLRAAQRDLASAEAALDRCTAAKKKGRAA
jgi:hypothetical protein